MDDYYAHRLRYGQNDLNETESELYDLNYLQELIVDPDEDPIPMATIGPLDDSDLEMIDDGSPLSSQSQSSVFSDYNLDNGLNTDIILSAFIDRLSTQAWVTHNALCDMRVASQGGDDFGNAVRSYFTSRGHVYQELQHAFLGSYHNAQLYGREVPCDGHVPITGWRDEDPDMITGAIMEDCPECFDLICQLIPELNCYGCNMYGWTYLSIAIECRSVRMLEYLFKLNKPAGATTVMMFLGANATQMTYPTTPWSIIAQKQDPRYLKYILDLWEPRLDLSILNTQTVDMFLTEKDKFDLCVFATYDLAVRLSRFGVHLNNVIITDMDPADRHHTLGATSWHAGALNGSGFLRYLEEFSGLSRLAPDSNGRTPLDWADYVNNGDSIVWLERHGCTAELPDYGMRARPRASRNVTGLFQDMDWSDGHDMPEPRTPRTIADVFQGLSFADEDEDEQQDTCILS
ncbi:hypothetical protein N7456_005648 [Penicillium angulare]|uniref:Uncharacterized protein n=1 Tax=Penicillium angulare TaxID=116970 RepID=A0A9W9KKQ5_9EURO|nr:hypothetical protein N7456_005648 [Penicillium angulare]